jgi:glycosyltransferase involved in cell wall biosynthesis
MNKIAVITRTKNRPLLLQRCAESLVYQTYKDFIWVVVNDNGEQEEVNNVAKFAISQGIKTQVIHRTEKPDVSAAANAGVTGSNSEFIHLLDDDDTVEASFYEQTVNFLDAKPHYMGVVTSTNRIDEKIEGNTISQIHKDEYSFVDSSIYIADILWKNLFTTNAFLYRRNVLSSIELYDENLPALDDWDFNIRFLQHFDIGAIPAFLANYHFRLGANTGGTAQTIAAGSGLHQEYTALLRNKYLRQDMMAGNIGLGTLISIGRYQQLQNNSLNIINDKMEALLIFRKLIKRIINFGRN